MNNVQRHAYLLVNFIEKCPENNCLLENGIQNKEKMEKKIIGATTILKTQEMSMT